MNGRPCRHPTSCETRCVPPGGPHAASSLHRRRRNRTYMRRNDRPCTHVLVLTVVAVREDTTSCCWSLYDSKIDGVIHWVMLFPHHHHGVTPLSYPSDSLLVPRTIVVSWEVDR